MWWNEATGRRTARCADAKQLPHAATGRRKYAIAHRTVRTLLLLLRHHPGCVGEGMCVPELTFQMALALGRSRSIDRRETLREEQQHTREHGSDPPEAPNSA